MSVGSELWSAEVMLGVDLTRLRYWWHSPIQDGDSLDKVCENQQAAKLLTQGLQRVLLLRDHRLVGSIVREQLRFAARLPDEPNADPTFAAPFWLIFLQQAAQTVLQWAAMCDEVPAELRADFVTQAWDGGAVQIAAGFPKAALEIWKRRFHEITGRHQRRTEAFPAAERDFASARALAAELGIASPAAPTSLTTEAYESAVESWRSSVLREALDRLFWQAQRPGLERVTFAQGAEKKRRARVKALLRSCDKQSSPDLLDHESLAEEAFVRIHSCLPSTIAESEERDAGQEPASE
ncbi:MAG TPA: hypothetical protein VHC20_04330 [Candidatus Paceibacterota bacterium]|jgi:hypothetical protein|nr:hypothetical protein [Candidatus Paceibacterota bacterium]